MTANSHFSKFKFYQRTPATAHMNADDPHSDDGTYDQFIPPKVLDNGCSRYHEIEGL